MPTTRSIHWKTAAACSAGKASRSSRAVTTCAQTKNGIRSSVIPRARHATTVASRLTAPSIAATPSRKMPGQPPRLARRRDDGQRRIRRPARVGGAAGQDEARHHQQPGHDVDDVAEHAQPRERQAAGADHQRHEVAAEAAGGQRHHRQEDHHRAVHRDELVVELRQQHAARRVGLAEDRRTRCRSAGPARPAASGAAASAGSQPVEMPHAVAP